ncbi:MAG: zinc-binding alcohol dehydrogenase family protein [Chakrabartia sp.]
MKAIRFHEKGPAEVLTLDEVEAPTPARDELLIRIEAAGISYGDILRRRGGHYPMPTPLPFTPGEAVAGTVAAVGEGVSPDWVGKRAYGRVTSGGYAEYGVGVAQQFLELPDSVSAADAVAVMSDGVTAALILKWVGHLRGGETVFVPAAAGGLGNVAVQLAKLYGAKRVFGGASNQAKRQAVLAAGADHAIDYTQEGWAAQIKALNDDQGVDLALEMTGGPVFYETIEAVRNGGRIVNYGNASDTDSPINPRQLLRRNLTLSGFLITGNFLEERVVAGKEVLGFLAHGALKAAATCYPLSDAARAHKVIEERASTGRQILIP